MIEEVSVVLCEELRGLCGKKKKETTENTEKTQRNAEKELNEKESNEERTENCGEIPRYTRDDNSSPLTND